MSELQTKTGNHFSTVDLGLFEAIDQFVFEAPEARIKAEGKIFLKQLLGLTSAEISINKLPPKATIPFYHKHRQNEEVYIFLQGEGEFQVDDCVFPVKEGTIVRVDREGERCWRNTADEDLYCIVIQTRAESYEDHTIQDGVGVQKRVSWTDKTRI